MLLHVAWGYDLNMCISVIVIFWLLQLLQYAAVIRSATALKTLQMHSWSSLEFFTMLHSLLFQFRSSTTIWRERETFRSFQAVNITIETTVPSFFSESFIFFVISLFQAKSFPKGLFKTYLTAFLPFKMALIMLFM